MAWVAERVVNTDTFKSAVMQVADGIALGAIADDMHRNLQDEYDMQGESIEEGDYDFLND